MHGIDRCVLGDSSRAAGHTPVQCVDVTARSVDASCPHLPAFQACVESERPAHRVRPRCRHLDDGRLGPSPPSGHHVTGRRGRTNVEPGLAVVDDESVRHPTATAGSPRSSTSPHRRRCPPCFTQGRGRAWPSTYRPWVPHSSAATAAAKAGSTDTTSQAANEHRSRRTSRTSLPGIRRGRHQGSASPTAGSSRLLARTTRHGEPRRHRHSTRHHQGRPPQLAAN